MRETTSVHFEVLGPLRVLVDGEEVRITSRRQRGLLVLLLLNAGRVVPSERLVDQLWDGNPPPQAGVTLRSYISNLRQALGGTDGVGGAIRTRAQGYSLDVPPGTVDAAQLGLLAEEGRRHLASEDPARALEAFDAAVDSWRGDPLADIADHDAVRSVIAQLQESHLGAVEGRLEALLALGRHADALPGLEALVAEQPLREGPRILLIQALYRSGRAAEALQVHHDYRVRLRDELGIDPSPRLRQLLQQVLDGDAVPDPTPDLRGGRRADDAGPSGRARTPSPAPAPVVEGIVGRSRELAALDDHLDGVAAHRAGALVLISGEPGIGKTTLLDGLAARAGQRRMEVHAGRAPSANGAPPFWPWSQVLGSIAAGLDDDSLAAACAGPARLVAHLSRAIADRIGDPVPDAGEGTQELRFLLYEAVVTFLRRVCVDRHVVITLDDLHWADLPSLELLSYLTPSLATEPLIVVAAYRDLPSERTDALAATLATVSREDVVHELHLGGLGREDVASLASRAVGAWPSLASDRRDQLVAQLHRRSGGNPFFVRQLARLLGDLDPEVPSARVVDALPRGVTHVVARRLTGLAEPVERLLAAAAVVGLEFDLSTAARAAHLPLDSALDAFDEAARHGLVEATGDGLLGRRFVHALVQEVILSRLPAGRAARLHADVADALAGAPRAAPARIATHMWEARDLVGPVAIASQLAAADAAASVYAHEEAETYVRRALDLVGRCAPPEPLTELRLLSRLFRLIAVERGWGDADVRDVAGRSLRLAATIGYGDESVLLCWSLFFAFLDRDDSTSYVELAAGLLHALERAETSARGSSDGAHPAGPPPDPASRAAVHLANIYRALAADDVASAHDHLLQARAHVDAASSDQLAAFDENLGVMTSVVEAFWAALHGDRTGHRSCSDAAIALADADGRPFPRAVSRALAASAAPYAHADPVYVRDLASQASAMCARFGFGWLGTLAECVEQWAAARLGAAPEEAARFIGEKVDEVVAAGRAGNQSGLLLLLADVHHLAGHRRQATAALERARATPGPYRALVVGVVESRAEEFGRTTP